MSYNPTSAMELRGGLMTLAAQIRAWLDWHKRHRDEQKDPPLTTDDGTHVMALPVPFWPTRGAFENWIKLFQNCHEALSPEARIAIIKECADKIGNMRQSEAGLLDAAHSGQRGCDRSDALYDAYQAVMSLAKEGQQ